MKDLRSALTIYFDEAHKSKPLENQERIELLKKAKQGNEEAKQELIKSFQLAVIHYAFKFWKPLPNADKNLLEDLIQDGNVEVCRIFNERLETLDLDGSILSLIVYRIKAVMYKCVNEKRRLIKISQSVVHKAKLYTRIKIDLECDLGREPTIEEIGVKIRDRIGHRQKVDSVESFRKDAEYLETNKVLSFDVLIRSKIDSDKGAYFSDIIEDKKTISPVEQTETNLLKEQLRKALPLLTSRQKQVITMIYGLDTGKEMMQKDVAVKMGLSRGAIECHKFWALRKLRKLMRIDSSTLG